MEMRAPINFRPFSSLSAGQQNEIVKEQEQSELIKQILARIIADY